MITKWEFIVSDPNGIEIVARELTYAYLLGLEDGHKFSDEQYKRLAEIPESVFNVMFNSYLEQLKDIKSDYYGVIA